MADGGLVLQIDEALAERLRVAADGIGESVEAYALRVLEEVSEVSDEPWDEDRERFAEYERTGVAEPAGPILQAFVKAVRDDASRR